MEQSYAQALWNMIEKGMEPKKAVQSLQGTLASHGREALLPRIGHAFSRLAAREMQKTGITLTVAEAKDAHKAERAAKDILKEMDVSMKEVTTKVDDSIIGGWRLEGREKLVDASFKKHLLNIYQRVTDTV